MITSLTPTPSSNDSIIEMVVSGEYHEFEPEKLRGLMKILPEQDEVRPPVSASFLLFSKGCAKSVARCQDASGRSRHDNEQKTLLKFVSLSRMKLRIAPT